ncbi:RDD family protein [Desulfopila sp. IMCC35008]|uniref:RDD family protein n=1 Tax=Desulfopila sp. IMCC35008 TaxID=2653858 RepID=UPI0013CFFFA7|nr:RDD family protein [Desulfopila sp. IMCC35008]
MALKLDTIIYHQSPEGVELSLSPAGPLSRGLAWLIDFGLRVALYIIIGICLSWAGGIGSGLTLIGVFLIEWFYPVLFEIRSGSTPGKKAIGLQVVHDDGTPVTWSSSLLRNLIRSVDLLPFFNMVGLITMIFNNRFKRLGDLAAGTVVIYRQNQYRESIIPSSPPLPPPIPLKLWQQRLILDFCERSESLSKERSAELATLLPTLTGEKVPQETLIQYGNWFLKGRGKRESDKV